jgi:hypothetical protein
MLPIHIVFWMIIRPLVFVDVQFWVELESVIVLLELFDP